MHVRRLCDAGSHDSHHPGACSSGNDELAVTRDVSGRRRARAKQWEVRPSIVMPRASFEELEVRTSDGTVLRAVVDDPPDAVPLRATLVLAHAMFARKSSFGRRDQPGLSSALAPRGFRTVAFDFRGHGDSTASRDWGYDDLVRVDLPAVVDCVRARGEGKPVIVIGHSLGGHVALAAQGTRRTRADAIVAVGANVWVRELESSRLRWAAKIGIARATLALAKRAGGIPARWLRLGSDDASSLYVRDLFRGVTDGAWRSADAADDYLAALRNVTVPVAVVLGERDRILCHPTSGEAFARRCRGAVALFHAPVGHVELVTSDRARATVIEAVEWATAQVAQVARDGDQALP
jgi:pimeloyl-ACP methyl ester carboxylesterase